MRNIFSEHWKKNSSKEIFISLRMISLATNGEMNCKSFDQLAHMKPIEAILWPLLALMAFFFKLAAIWPFFH